MIGLFARIPEYIDALKSEQETGGHQTRAFRLAAMLALRFTAG